MALAEGPVIQITAPPDGASIRAVAAVVATSSQGTVSVTFDWSSDGGTTWRPIAVDTDSSDGWAADWDTSGYDGPAVLRATGVDPTGSAESTVALTVDNTAPVIGLHVTPSLISPNHDGRFDHASLAIASSEPVSIAAKVVDARGTLVRQLATTYPGGKGDTRLVWDGTRDHKKVADGSYGIVVTGTDAAGNSSTVRRGLRVDTTPPQIAMRSVAPEPVDRGPLAVRYTLRDADGPMRTKAVLLSEAGVVRIDPLGAHTSGRASGRVPLRSANGGLLIPGLYRVQISATDRAGNEASSRAAPFRVIRPVHTTVWREVPGAGRHVALTFDDCNDHDAWNRILDILHERSLHATFFCIGLRVAEYDDMARKTIELGDSAGNHTWDHANPTGLGAAAIRTELERTAAVWWRTARATPAPYFRPPYGAYDSTTLAVAGAAGYLRTILWDVDPRDWEKPGASTIEARVLGAVGPGDIVVMHVQAETADALSAILDGLRRKGLQQSSIPELFASAGLR